jgi:hypothetical protein
VREGRGLYAFMVRDRGRMKGARRVTLLRSLLVAPVFLLLCFAFALPLSPFESRRPRADGLAARDPVIPLVGEAGASPVQALVGALRSATAAASAHMNGTFNDHDAEV